MPVASCQFPVETDHRQVDWLLETGSWKLEAISDSSLHTACPPPLACASFGETLCLWSEKTTVCRIFNCQRSLGASPRTPRGRLRGPFPAPHPRGASLRSAPFVLRTPGIHSRLRSWSGLRPDLQLGRLRLSTSSRRPERSRGGPLPRAASGRAIQVQIADRFLRHEFFIAILPSISAAPAAPPHWNGFRTVSRPSITCPSCRSSEYNVSHSASSADAAIKPSNML